MASRGVCSALLSSHFFASHSILSPALPLQILYSPVFSSERRAKFVSKYKKEEKNFFLTLMKNIMKSRKNVKENYLPAVKLKY